MSHRVLLSWSSGKDSAWALHVLRRRADVELVGLLTTFNEAFDRVAMHGVRHELVERQAEAVGLPLWSVPLPWPCSNQEYEARMRTAIERARSAGVTHVAFGDLYLADVRAYREKQLAGTGIEPLFPLWDESRATARLIRDMLDGGLRARLVCLDPKRLSSSFAGRELDERLLAELPAGVDPCGENGEFHTFCHDGPDFTRPITLRVGEVVERDGFVFVDLH